jgi:glycosyltransferase involved in cell wall biosynthesis
VSADRSHADVEPTVLLVTGAYAPEIGTAGLQCQMVARALAGRVRFRVLTTAIDPSLPRQSVIDDVAVSRTVVDVKSWRSKLRAADEMIRDLAGLLRGADVVHLHGYSSKNVLATAISTIARVPIVMSLHTAGFDEPASIAGHGRLARWTFDAARLYLCVSPRLADACRAAAVPPERIRYAPNGVDIDRFRPVEREQRRALRVSLGIDGSRPATLFVGFFSQDKQPHVLFDAWLELQDDPATASTLLFVGATRSAYFEVDDRLAADMRSRAARYGVAERLVFVEPTLRIDDYYRAADLFVLPSLREGTPVALLEAMSSGLAVVASRLPGSTDAIIDDGAMGLLVPPGDVAAFAGAMRQVLSDKERAAALGAAARRRVVADFSADRVANAWRDAYRDVLTS